MSVLNNAWTYIANQISAITVFDLVDIAIVSVIIYYVLKFVRERRAGKLAVGIVLIIVTLFLSDLFNMHALNFLLQNIVQVGIIGLLIVFQTELRTVLEKVGGNSFVSVLNKKGGDIKSTVTCIDNVIEACMDFSDTKTGALIVFERTTKLGDVIKSGTIIDSEPAVYLIKNLFFNKAPLHDGALIIRANRLYSAGCFLPLSLNQDIIKDLGTRHRAAIGMSEISDCVVVVVSEETGIISIACDGVLTRGYNEFTLKNDLMKYLADIENKNVRNSKVKEKLKFFSKDPDKQ